MTSATRRISPPHSGQREDDVVDVRPVQVEVVRHRPDGHLAQLGDAADAVRVPVLAAPEGSGVPQ